MKSSPGTSPSPQLACKAETSSDPFVGRGGPEPESPRRQSEGPPRFDRFGARLKEIALERELNALGGQIEEVEEQLDLQEERELYLRDFYGFCSDILGFDRLYLPLHGPLCQQISDPRLLRVLVLLPRGHFKTTIISICYPLWRLCRDQNCRIALLSVSADKAEENLAEIRDRAQRPAFLRLFGDTVGHPDTWLEKSSSKIRIPRSGNKTGPSIATYGVDSKEVGRHFDVMLLDDICDQEKVNTQEARDKTWAWYGRQLSVLDPGSKLCVLGTIWHYDDVYSRIMATATPYSSEAPLGWTIVKRKAIENGEVIFPTRFSKPILDEIKKTQGDFIYSCFYDNEPTSVGMNPFDLRQFQWVDYTPPSESEDREEKAQTPITHMFIDPAQSKAKWACFTGIVIADATWEHKVVIREAFLEKVHPDEAVDLIFSLAKKYNVKRIGIEDEGYQNSLVFWLRREQLMRGEFFQVLPVKIPRNVAGTVRKSAVQPFIHRGDIVFNARMEGRSRIVEEFERFPKGPHDDLVSAISMIPNATLFPTHKAPADEKPEKEMPRILEFLDIIANRRHHSAGRFSRIKVKRMRA